MPSPEQLSQIDVQNIILVSPRTGITDAGIDHVVKSGAEHCLSVETSGALPEERVRAPRLPRVEGATNRWGAHGEHIFTPGRPKEPPVTRSTSGVILNSGIAEAAGA